ncbi:MAG: HlyC/CorC family transporter [Lachnospiraceae bacterium]|jgi:putative hemolysin|nr:HlyC/CorC family transporter [Lachnospiraceae bacterium]
MGLFGKKTSEEQADAVEEEIRSIIEEGHEQGAIQTDEAEMITNVFEFGDKIVRDVCCPRQKIVGIEADTEIMDALNIMLENSYSRYPIYEENIDNIIGVLHIKEAVLAYLDDANQTVRELGSEPYYVHPTQKIRKLFNEMQNSKNHLAIVVDEYGQTEGLIALEDILEVIVGDILDEHDEKEIDIMKLATGDGYIVNGSTELAELEDLFGIKFPDEDINTVNGFMLYQIGSLPDEKEHIQVEYQGFLFVATKWEEHSITKVRIRKL